MGRLLVFASLLPSHVFVRLCHLPPRTQVLPNEEWPSGPGTIPPSWYDYNPALKHWFDPWFSNPAIPK